MNAKDKGKRIGGVVGLIGSFGTGMLLSTAFLPVAATNPHLVCKIMMGVGTVGLSGWLGDKVQAWYVAQGEALGEAIDTIKDKTIIGKRK